MLVGIAGIDSEVVDIAGIDCVVFDIFGIDSGRAAPCATPAGSGFSAAP
jgi:hypothetical protein